jgi:SAM-dependent methyltransferase
VTELRTDYERLADSYDEDRRRWQDVPPDDNIAALSRGDAVLDLGCGTGTYLRAQCDAFPDIAFVGADPSAGMLEHASAKARRARYVRAGAEALPFADAVFRYVNLAYAFHHVVDKDEALREIVRVLGPRGRFRMMNVEPYSLQRWWVFTFFDGTHDNDMVRFWPPERIASTLESLHVDVDVDVTVDDIALPVAEVRADAERRVISQLAVLDDARYEAGLARLRELDDDAMVASQAGSLTLTATKR